MELAWQQSKERCIEDKVYGRKQSYMDLHFKNERTLMPRHEANYKNLYFKYKNEETRHGRKETRLEGRKPCWKMKTWLEGVQEHGWEEIFATIEYALLSYVFVARFLASL